MCPNRIDELGALTDKYLTSAEQHSMRLLVFIFHGDCAHRRPRRSFDDRFSINRIVFVALDERFDVECRYEPNLMSGGLRNASPMMGGATSFHGNDARRQLRKHFLELRSGQFLF